MTHHELLIRSDFFTAIETGLKTFEVRRKRGRTFAPGDRVTLREIAPDGEPTGWQFERTITYVLDGADIGPLDLIDDDVVVFGLAARYPVIPNIAAPIYLKEPSL